MRNEGREINEFLNEWRDVSAWESKVVGWGRRGGCDSRRAFNSLGEGAKGRKGALRRDTTSKNERRAQKVKKRGGGSEKQDVLLLNQYVLPEGKPIALPFCKLDGRRDPLKTAVGIFLDRIS